MTKFWFSVHEATKTLNFFFFPYEASENFKWFAVLLPSHSAVFLEVTHAVVGGALIKIS